MTKCTSANSIYGDICFSPGKKSLPGVRGYVYGIAKRDIMTWPTIGTEAPKTLADVAKYAGDFVLATDKKWHKIGLIPNESELQAESQGSFGSKTFKVTGTAVIPGTEEEVSGYIAQANNDEMVYLFIQRNGKARMVLKHSLLSFRFRRVQARLQQMPTLPQFRLLPTTSIQHHSILARSRQRMATSLVQQVYQSLLLIILTNRLNIYYLGGHAMQRS